MSKFAYGEEFLRINAELLEAYSKCKDGTEVIKVQDEWLAENSKETREEPEDEMLSDGSSVQPTSTRYSGLDSDVELDALGNIKIKQIELY